MELRIIRNQYESAAGYTVGRLYTPEAGYFCDTLEPEDRGLHQDMSMTQILAKKVTGKTAIPRGRYRIQMLVSPSFKDRYYARPYGGRFPYISEIPGFSSVLIHPGNWPADTRACILPGVLHSGIRGRLFDSVLAWDDLMKFYIWPAYERKEAIWLTIE